MVVPCVTLKWHTLMDQRYNNGKINKKIIKHDCIVRSAKGYQNNNVGLCRLLYYNVPRFNGLKLFRIIELS